MAVGRLGVGVGWRCGVKVVVSSPWVRVGGPRPGLWGNVRKREKRRRTWVMQKCGKGAAKVRREGRRYSGHECGMGGAACVILPGERSRAAEHK